MRLSWAVFVVLVVLVSFPQAASDPSEVVREIRVEGFAVTKEYIIRREIQHPLGVPFDSVLASEDRDRIDNLGIFSDVQYDLRPNGDGTVTLVYHVVETWRFLPLPIIMYQEETGWSFGAMVIMKNFRGRNELLQVFGAAGGSQFGGIQFQDPWIVGDHVSLQSHIFLNRYDHPFLPFQYRELDAEITVGRYFGYRWKVWATVSLEKRWADYFDEAADLIHRYVQTKFQLIYDSRDLYIDPSKGTMVFAELRPDIGLDNNSPHNAYLQGQASFYRTIIPGPRKWVVGGSFFCHKYFGESIPYNILSVGGAKSVRGWEVVDTLSYSDESYRTGLNLYHASVELRQTLVPKHLTGIGTEFGLILAEFADMGAADDSFLNALKEKPIWGVGTGLRFYIPGNMLFRIDYGIGYYDGEFQSWKWHIDIGHKF